MISTSLDQLFINFHFSHAPDNSAVIDGRHLVLGACGDGMLVHAQTPICVPFLPRVPQPIRLQDIKLIPLSEQLNQQHGALLQSDIFADDEKMPTISSRSDLVKMSII